MKRMSDQCTPPALTVDANLRVGCAGAPLVETFSNDWQRPQSLSFRNTGNRGHTGLRLGTTAAYWRIEAIGAGL
jgi:hypothetical protein